MNPARHLLAQRDHDRVQPGGVFGILTRDAPHDPVKVRLRLRDRHTRLQARQHLQIMSAAIGKRFRSERDRNP